MRVLICAGRHYADSRLCRRVLDASQRMHLARVLIHGGNQYLVATSKNARGNTAPTSCATHPTGSATARRRNACAIASCCSTADRPW